MLMLPARANVSRAGALQEDELLTPGRASLQP